MRTVERRMTVPAFLMKLEAHSPNTAGNVGKGSQHVVQAGSSMMIGAVISGKQPGLFLRMIQK